MFTENVNFGLHYDNSILMPILNVEINLNHFIFDKNGLKCLLWCHHFLMVFSALESCPVAGCKHEGLWCLKAVTPPSASSLCSLWILVPVTLAFFPPKPLLPPTLVPLSCLTFFLSLPSVSCSLAASIKPLSFWPESWCRQLRIDFGSHNLISQLGWKPRDVKWLVLGHKTTSTTLPFGFLWHLLISAFPTFMCLFYFPNKIVSHSRAGSLCISPLC